MAIKQDVWEMLQECFDPEEFKMIFASMKPDAQKFRYYMDMLKLLTLRGKNARGGDSQGNIDKLLDEMFNVKKK